MTTAFRCQNCNAVAAGAPLYCSSCSPAPAEAAITEERIEEIRYNFRHAATDRAIAIPSALLKKDFAASQIRASEEYVRANAAEALIRAQANVLAAARRSALEEAAKVVEDFDVAYTKRLNERASITADTALVICQRDIAIAEHLRALTEPQHGNG